MALLANLHRDPNKTTPFSRADFHPLQGDGQEGAEVEPDEFIDILAHVYQAE